MKAPWIASLLILGGIVAYAVYTSYAEATVASRTYLPRLAPEQLSVGHSLAGLHVSGHYLVNGQGQAVQLHGVTRAGWYNACVGSNGTNGFGFTSPPPGPPALAEVLAMLDWNVNVVRVGLNESCWLNTPPGMNQMWTGINYRFAVARYVALLNQHNIAAIISLAWNDPSGYALAQHPMADRAHSPAFWSSVAITFANNPLVLFDVFNEPVPYHDNGPETDAAWACWRDGGACPGSVPPVGFTAAGMTELLSAVRVTGAKNIVILGGVHWSSAFNAFLRYVPIDSAHQLAAGKHDYGDLGAEMGCPTITCWNTQLQGLLNAGFPIIATEVGDYLTCSPTNTLAYLSWADSVFQSYVVQEWSPHGCTVNNRVDTLLAVGNLNDPASYNGMASVPFGATVRDRLMGRP